jgi:hypothetical protein
MLNLQSTSPDGFLQHCAITRIDASQVAPTGIKDLDLAMLRIPGVIALAIQGPPNFPSSPHPKEFARIKNRWLRQALSSHCELCRCHMGNSRRPTCATPFVHLLLVSLLIQPPTVPNLIATTNPTIFLPIVTQKQRSTHRAGTESITEVDDQIDHTMQNSRSFIWIQTYNDGAAAGLTGIKRYAGEIQWIQQRQLPHILSRCVFKGLLVHYLRINWTAHDHLNHLTYVLLQRVDVCGGHIRREPASTAPLRHRDMPEIITQGFQYVRRQSIKVPPGKLEYPSQAPGIVQGIDTGVLMPSETNLHKFSHAQDFSQLMYTELYQKFVENPLDSVSREK